MTDMAAVNDLERKLARAIEERDEARMLCVAAERLSSQLQAERDDARREQRDLIDAIQKVSDDLVDSMALVESNRREIHESRKSLSFLRGQLGQLAIETGLAVEDVGGIIRACKERDGAGGVLEDIADAFGLARGITRSAEKKALVLEAERLRELVTDLEKIQGMVGEQHLPTSEAVRLTIEARDRWKAQALEASSILRRIGDAVRVQKDETVEAAVARVARNLDAAKAVTLAVANGGPIT